VPSITAAPMLVFRSKVAGRVALQRHPLSNATNFTRRHNSTNPTTKKNAVNDTIKGASIPVQNPVAPLPVWQRLGVLSKGIQAYGRSQSKRPYATQFVASLVIYLLGDLSAQNIGGDAYDPHRTLRALVISACSSIQTYKWLLWLDF
jgi:protein Mpv17